ncbi:MAG: hypothetical protein KBG20_16160 [Caldilineaceae bacterium]|nr:hypothetical protein [Caldilineaceae bacterium]MBP8107169.1 hypothetical protein [Caldilineaceae bacterium]MBP8121513.1 hypothetical protein [Caldilineaceae bacterium]MBP9073843.1 hypothetical protein [Caldilineaceae bacterium]
MTTFTLTQPDLVAQIEQAATEKEMTGEEVLASAVSDYLERRAHRKIVAESEAFAHQRPQILAAYPNEYIAMHNGHVVDHDPDLRSLNLRVRRRFGQAAILMQKADAESKELIFRSPHLFTQSS